jgi:PIN domain nuclease of toxin-antitoxin system
MSEIVLDASALLALLKDESGGEKVAEGLSASCISAVNYAEVVSYFIDAGMPASAVDAMLSPLPITIVAANADLATLAGRLRATTAEAGRGSRGAAGLDRGPTVARDIWASRRRDRAHPIGQDRPRS